MTTGLAGRFTKFSVQRSSRNFRERLVPPIKESSMFEGVSMPQCAIRCRIVAGLACRLQVCVRLTAAILALMLVTSFLVLWPAPAAADEMEEVIVRFDLQGPGTRAPHPQASIDYMTSRGGRVIAEGTFNAGEVLELYIGTRSISRFGGWNGGGDGMTNDSGSRLSYGGAGAADVRVGGTDLADRIIVAGGAGGAGDHEAFGSCFRSELGSGGRGGANTGEDGLADKPEWGHEPARGGSQTSGGAGGIANLSQAAGGSFGQGANVQDGGGNLTACYGGGGGGGWYGGGAGGSTAMPTPGDTRRTQSGGGGSNYIHENLTEITNERGGGREGHSLITLTFIDPRNGEVFFEGSYGDGGTIYDLTGRYTETVPELPNIPPPGPVTNLTISDPQPGSQGEVNWLVSWDEPEEYGGVPITAYRVFSEWDSGAQTVDWVDGETRSVRVDMDPAGGVVELNADNEVGLGDPSTINVPGVSAPVMPASPPIFVSALANSGGSTNFEISIQIEALADWGVIEGFGALSPGDYIFTYEAASGPVTVVEGGGSGAGEFTGVLTIPADELVDGEPVRVDALNDYGQSSTSITATPVFEASIVSLSGLSASTPTWIEEAGAYATDLSWADYSPFAGSGTALELLQGSDRPSGTVTVVVGNTPPVTTNTDAGGIDVILDNVDAPQFGNASAEVVIEGLGGDVLISPEAVTAVADVSGPPVPSLTLSNQRFNGSLLEHDIVVEPANAHTAPIAEVEVVAADDGVFLDLQSSGSDVFSGTLTVDFDSADYQNPSVGIEHPAAELRLVDAASLSGASGNAEIPTVPDPGPVEILGHNLVFDGAEAVISLELAVVDLEMTGPTEQFVVTLDDDPVVIGNISGDVDQPTVEVTVPAGELMTETVVGVSRSSITGETSSPAETTIAAVEADLTLEKALSDAPDPIAKGSELEYTLTARNVGDVTLTDVVLSDSLITPENATCSSLGPDETCVLTGIYMVTQADVDAGEVVNTGSASGLAPNDDPVDADDDTLTTPIDAESELSLVKKLTDAPQPIEVGSVLTYTVTVENTGDVTLTNVFITDPRISPSSKQCETLAPNDSCVLEGEYTVAGADEEEGFIVNTASAEADGVSEVTAEHVVAVGDEVFSDRFNSD